jgi:hypothetical protein
MEAMTMKTLLVVLLLLLLGTGTASAECEWVLWDEHRMSHHAYKTAEGNIPGARGDGNSGEWLNIIASFPTYGGCEEAQAQKISQILGLWRKQKAEERPTFTYGKGGGGKYTINYEPGSNVISMQYERVDEQTFYSYESHRYRCLPDTVDPRGPKGK